MQWSEVWTLRFRGKCDNVAGVLERHIVANGVERAEATGQATCAERGWIFLGVAPFIIDDDSRLLDRPAPSAETAPARPAKPSLSEQRARMEASHAGDAEASEAEDAPPAERPTAEGRGPVRPRTGPRATE